MNLRSWAGNGMDTPPGQGSKSMEVRPLKDRILVKQDPPKTMIGLIHIPDKEYPTTGIVARLGPEAAEGISVGDRVLFKRRAGSALVPDDREPGARSDEMRDYVMLKSEDILAIIEEE